MCKRPYHIFKSSFSVSMFHQILQQQLNSVIYILYLISYCFSCNWWPTQLWSFPLICCPWIVAAAHVGPQPVLLVMSFMKLWSRASTLKWEDEHKRKDPELISPVPTTGGTAGSGGTGYRAVFPLLTVALKYISLC